MTNKTFSPTLEVKRVNRKTGQITGMLVSYKSVDLDGERFAPYACTRAINKIRYARRTVPLLWNHNKESPIGTIKDFDEKSDGVYITAQLSMGLKNAGEYMELAGTGAVGLSVGFIAGDSEMQNGVRVINEVQNIIEGSLTAIPSNADTKVHAVKSFNSKRDLERALKQVGLTNAQAKSLIAGGWNTFSGRAPEADPLDSALDGINNLLQQIKGNFK